MTKIAFLPFLLVLAACAKDGGAPGSAANYDPTTDDGAAQECPIISSANWSAWIDAMPPGPSRLHIRGEVAVASPPTYTVSWRVSAADRMMPPGQHMLLDLTRVGPALVYPGQNFVSMEVAYQGEATYPEYRVIYVHCGDAQLAEITEIPTAH